ncbi:2,4-dienoyl-CoA reductase [Haematobacter missouriensis]|uniref:2,4-dienoyl-CoA reductase n=1 Tax=Haematobacter missouriensis TaxID=366616 RepID=A0A212AKN8_9RHOB|nr:NADH:flavin oxidoreductase/NADH oxidase family protein [Haematobacter missouriensis]KFI24435.1 2,4-dienoyl-CoA reductase [Haematobacter missouriensis]OWJ73590.1 2,4-dienoyl-CoA reductase [Haematobacter missouriensis]OWJ81995.1 2,4-dienoyl-CoA reductase [Haematobacter missouriensis]
MTATPEILLFQPLRLPGGQIVKNRIAKAAMEENMADTSHLPGAELRQLYRRWAEGGAGLLLTGNVMVAPDAVTGPAGVILDMTQPLQPFRDWAQAGQANGARLWMQINHPGRQVYAATNPQAIAPSAVPVAIEGYAHLFAQPRAMSDTEIAEVIRRFADTAALAEEAGFDGVQVHAAHGYLLSQFLSPLTNRRADRWGGSLENRARILIEIIRAIRARVAPGFGVGVKLNSSDFQKGGFESQDAVAVVRMLNKLPVDLVELSGGSYESPAMHGRPQQVRTRQSTLAREAYFVDFARDIVAEAGMPVMVTGGIRHRATAHAALESEGDRAGVAMVGLGQALAYSPDLPNRWQAGESAVDVPVIHWKNRALSGLATMALTKLQLRRLGAGRSPRPQAWAPWVLARDRLRMARRSRRYRNWLQQRPTA